MQLNLRKARKIETKIRGVVDSASIPSSAKIRALATDEERTQALEHGRANLMSATLLVTRLIKARFAIRNAIAKANSETGISDLMAQREEIQALLAKTQTDVEVLDTKEADDMVKTRKASLENGSRAAYSESSVTLNLPVATKEDVESFKRTEKDLRKQLENVEDELSQKNVGVKITLDQETASLLQTVGLL